MTIVSVEVRIQDGFSARLTTSACRVVSSFFFFFRTGTARGWSCWRCEGASPGRPEEPHLPRLAPLAPVFIMTADVIVAGPLDSDCNCEYPPPLLPPSPLPSAITSCHRQKREREKKQKENMNFSPLSPVMFKPFMLLVVVWGGCTMRSVQGIKEKKEKRRTLTGKLT